MPAPYSYDLRKKAIKAVKKGEKKIQVCRMFQISRNTLDLWLKKEKETGDYQAIANHSRPTRKIQDEENFRDFLKKNKDKTQEQMAELWGDHVTQQNISYFCKKIGITRKKKPTVITKEMKEKEQNL